MCIIGLINRLFFPAGPVAPVRQAWQPLSRCLAAVVRTCRTTLSSDLVRTLAVAPTAFSYDKDDGEGVGAGLFYVTASAVLRGEAHGVLPSPASASARSPARASWRSPRVPSSARPFGGGGEVDTDGGIITLYLQVHATQHEAPPELSCPLMALEVESVTVLITGPTAATPFTTTFTSLRVSRKSLPMV